MPTTALTTYRTSWLRLAWDYLTRKEFLSSSADVSAIAAARGYGGAAEWGEWENRYARLNLFWALYESTTYDNIHRWAHQYKIDYALYPAIRDIFNPTYRLVEFWAAHLMGGALDPAAGDGKTTPSALPIETSNDELRPAIAQLWRDSRWQINKTMLGRLGAAMGDVGIETVDDPGRGQVYHRIVDPRTLVDYDADAKGNCRGYCLEEVRPDPRPETAWRNDLRRNHVIFRQEVRKVPEGVEYLTLLDDGTELIPYDWSDEFGDERGSYWLMPYPFVPFVLINHVRLLPDSPFGAPEIFAGRAKIHEMDDLASRISDAIAKSVDPAWLFRGIQKPRSDPTVTGSAPTRGNPAPNRNEMPALYGSEGSGAQALVAPHDFDGWNKHVASIMDAIKEDYPEVRRDNEWSYGDASGKSLRVARQRVETKAVDRRACYDHGIIQATQQAIAIAGEADYKGYEAFSFGSYPAGELDFRIGNRSVFGRDPEDDLDRDKLFWANAESADRAGCPLPGYLELQGWDAKRIGVVTAARNKAIADGLPVGRAKQASTGGDPIAGAASQAPGATAP